MASTSNANRDVLEDETGARVEARAEADPNYTSHSIVAQALDGGWGKYDFSLVGS